MAIGERIRFFRNMKGITQKYLGMVVGFPERSADVRMAQYETGSRTPKADLTKTLADFFDISPDALTVPDIDTDIGLMHTLFALEDIRGLTIGEIDGEVCLRLDKSKGKTYTNMLDMLSAWAEQAKKREEMCIRDRAFTGTPSDLGPHAQIISVSTISAAHARILLVPLQLIPQTVALVKDVLFHEITSIFCDYRAPTLIFDLAPHFRSFSTCSCW